MKSINKLDALKEFRVRNSTWQADYESYYDVLLIEKEVGLLGHECRFIVKLINAFQTEVFSNDYEFFIIFNQLITIFKSFLAANRSCVYSTLDEKRIAHIFHFMEFLNGGSLQWHLEKTGTFTEKQVVFYSAQILCGILFLHSKQIVHRDIKLENVLLDSNGNAKLCDFGFCRKISNKSSYIYGTEKFRSPESFVGGYLHYSLDFWSLGICIYYMLTGEFPFENEKKLSDDTKMPDMNLIIAKNHTNILNKLFLGRVTSIDDRFKISHVACEFVSKLLNKDLEERLGNKDNNEDIKSEPFFASIEWDKLEKGELKPPIDPNVVSF